MGKIWIRILRFIILIIWISLYWVIFAGSFFIARAGLLSIWISRYTSQRCPVSIIRVDVVLSLVRYLQYIFWLIFYCLILPSVWTQMEPVLDSGLVEIFTVNFLYRKGLEIMKMIYAFFKVNWISIKFVYNPCKVPQKLTPISNVYLWLCLNKRILLRFGLNKQILHSLSYVFFIGFSSVYIFFFACLSGWVH